MEAPATGVKKHLPNIASCVRIFGTLALPFLMWDKWEINVGKFTNVPFIWIIVFLFLVFTDKVDGTLARKLHAESELGANLDALGDALVLVVGGLCVFLKFIKGKINPEWLFWLYVAIMALCVANKVLVLLLTKKFHGKGNMLHSYPQKLFALACFIAVAVWAFLRDLPLWSILILLAINIYATIDECLYVARSADYDVDFKGHGFEQYSLKK
ncbi:MAG: CDP-alcohol phosphatidyltransferase family protein [Oscillospiraceae bacterium]|nr:CDP-alcohol phosphatidyltransferase family protein [Oscillospiraceae bacterium]